MSDPLEPSEDPEIRALFLDEMRKHVAAIVRAPADTSGCVRALHAMRGAAGMLGLGEIAARLLDAESAVRAGDPSAASRVLPGLAPLLRQAGFAVEGMGFGEGEETAVPVSPVPRASDRPSLDPDVLSFFFSEARARLERLDEALGGLSRTNSRESLDDAFRHVHSVKGAASTVGLHSIARAAHAFEGALTALRAAGRPLESAEIDTLTAARAHLAVALSSPVTAPEAAEKLVAVLRGAGLIRETDLRPVEHLPSDRPRQSPGVDVIRVPVAAVAGLSERVSDVGFVGDRVAVRAASVHDAARALSSAAHTVEDALRRIGPPRPWGAPADALEQLTGVARALGQRAQELDREGDGIDHDAEVLSGLAGSARESLQKLGGTNAAWLFDRVIPAAESLARREQKALRVLRRGDEVEIARGLAERLVEPLVQLARNAVVHGVEAPATRMARGKPSRGTLLLAATRSGDLLRIAVEDDGAGVDLEAVADRARSLGLLAEHETRDPAAVLSALFLPGLSTRKEADAAAGRGVGLDLVQREVVQAGGTITVASQRGAFTRFEIEIAPRPIAQSMLVVAAGAERFALPLDRVVRVVPGPGDAPPGVGVLSLARALGARDVPAAKGPVVLVNTPKGMLGLQVQQILRARDFVVRPLPTMLSAIRAFSAATVDGEGRVTLIVDVDQLARE